MFRDVLKYFAERWVLVLPSDLRFFVLFVKQVPSPLWTDVVDFLIE
jgi:hypothetical protein